MTICSNGNTGPEKIDHESASPPASTATAAATVAAPRPAPVRPKPDTLPMWRVLLHNDDHNDIDYVVETIVRVVRLNRPSATRCTIEAHRKGLGQVVATHRERAEFIAEQLRSSRLTVTIEPVR
jgi:ATP-dependent Clp protease adaptor protein ClpS